MTDWKSVQLGEVCTLQRGMDLPKRIRQDGEFPLVTSSGIDGTHNVGPVKGPGVITGRYGTIGKVFFLEQDFWPLNTTLYVRDFHGNDVRFVHYLLQTVDFQSHSGKSGVPGVNRNDVHQEFVCVPTDGTEQKRISQTLLDADALIDSLEQLLSKKRQIKQGAMQELLTGKRRLPGFAQPWISRKFSDIATVSRERVNPSALNMPPLCIELEHMEPSTGRLLTDAFESEQAATKSVFRRGDVLFGKLRAYLRKYWLAEFDGVCSTEIWVLRSRGELGSNDYLFFTIQRDDFVNAASTAYGTHMPRSDWKVVAEFDLALPSDTAEQAAVAQVLSDMDTEIASLESRLTKARALKRTMAQALLSGTIRLI